VLKIIHILTEETLEKSFIRLDSGLLLAGNGGSPAKYLNLNESKSLQEYQTH
jgi:hypothetical protein